MKTAACAEEVFLVGKKAFKIVFQGRVTDLVICFLHTCSLYVLLSIKSEVLQDKALVFLTLNYSPRASNSC